MTYIYLISSKYMGKQQKQLPKKPSKAKPSKTSIKKDLQKKSVATLQSERKTTKRIQKPVKKKAKKRKTEKSVKKITQKRKTKRGIKQTKSFKLSNIEPIPFDSNEAVFGNDYTNDARQLCQNPSQFPFSAIGLLYMAFSDSSHYEYFGTGFLIGTNILLTAAHNIYIRDSKKSAKKCKLTMEIHQDEKSYQALCAYIPKQYKQLEHPKDARKYDYAIVILQNIGHQSTQKYQTIILSQEMQSNDEIEIYGYPWSLSVKKFYQDKQLYDKGKTNKFPKQQSMFGCKNIITALEQKTIYHNVDTGTGQSGSPVLRFNKDQKKYKAIGVHSGRASQVNGAVRITDEVWKRISKWISDFLHENHNDQIIIFAKEENKVKDIETWRNMFAHPLFQKSSQRNKMQDCLNSELAKYKKLDLSNKCIECFESIDEQVEQITIISDRKVPVINDVNAIKALSKLKNIKKLEIGWCHNMSIQLTNEILDNMPQLQQLSIFGHGASPSIIAKLLELKQLRQFHFNRDSHPMYLYKWYEDIRFIALTELPASLVPSMNQTLQISKLAKLTNIQIAQTANQQSAKVISNMSSLKHLKLGYEQTREDQLHKNLIKQMEGLSNLISLCLVGLQLKCEQDQIRSLIRKNTQLNTFVVRQGYPESLYDSSIEQLAKNGSKLLNIIIQGQHLITGSNFAKFQNLKLLSLQDCRRIKKELIQQGLLKMNQLTHLVLRFNESYRWANDELMGKIGHSCTSLALIDITNTGVTGKGLLQLKPLKQLSILICDSNGQIKGTDLVEFTKDVHTIRKLSISRLEVSNTELLQINENCQSAITHLNVDWCNITVEALLKMKQLKAVSILKLKQIERQKLSAAGIKNKYN